MSEFYVTCPGCGVEAKVKEEPGLFYYYVACTECQRVWMGYSKDEVVLDWVLYKRKEQEDAK